MPKFDELVFGVTQSRLRHGISGIALLIALPVTSMQLERIAHAIVIRSALDREVDVIA